MTNEILNIILSGLKEAGNYYGCFIRIEEQLPMTLVDDVEQFLAWLDKNDATIGSANVLSRWNEFDALPQSKKNKFKLEGSKSHKEVIERGKKDITTELVKGNVLHVHSFSYPLKHAIVMNYDATSKVLTLQL